MAAFWENDPIIEETPPAKGKAKAFWENDPIISEPNATPKQSGDVSVGSVARSLFRGLPGIGTFRDELAAGGRALAASATGGLVGQDYESGVALERARDKAFSEQHPVLDTGLNVAGGIYGTVAAAPYVAGPAAASAVGRTLLGIGARTLPGAVARGATAGLAQGALAGAGEAEGGFVDRGVGAVKGGAIGGALGGALPLAIGAGRSALTPLYERWMGTGDALSNLSRPARNYVAQISSPDALDRMEQGLGRLGHQGMFADVSPEWNAIAGAAASRPGGRDQIARPLEDRVAGSVNRMRTDLNENFGPAVVPSRVEGEISENLKTVGAQYDPALDQASAIDTQPLAERLEAMIINKRGPAQAALRQARELLNVPGTDQLDPNPRAIHEVRMALDGLKEEATNSKARTAYGEARSAIDDLLAGSVPGIKELDEQYARIAAQKNALTQGQTLLDTGRNNVVRPTELSDALEITVQPGQRFAGPSAEPFRQRQGLRAELDRVVGTKANDARALRSVVSGGEAEGDWNPQKLETMFGQEPTRNVLGAINREVRFQDTANSVIGGSPTAQRQHFAKAIDAVESPLIGSGSTGDTHLTGLALNTLKRIGTVMTGAIGQARANRFASELGEMAVSRGATRDEFIAAMRRAGLNRAQIGRTLDMATRGGLIVSREASTALTGRTE